MIKGVHIELRGQLMHVERMIDVMRDVARWGYNAIMLEYYDKFPYQGRIADAVAPDALTHDDIDQLKSAAREFGLEIIPLVQNLGHLYWALRRPSLEPLGEGYGNEEYIAKHQKHMHCLTSLCPSRPTSLEFFKEMASQVMQVHPEARYFHMGGDEVSLDPDCPHCKPRRESEGVGGVLTAHYAAVAEWIRSQGPEPVMWGDMILAHPESLEKMRGKVTVMDWNYWSTSEASNRCVAWGIPADKIHDPDDWTEAQRRIVLPYMFNDEGKMKPFLFTPLLKDQGFDVFVAPAVRSGGDSFFAPKASSIDNVIGAARAAVRNDTLGMVVTSWALRRAPWPMTEQALMAGAMTCENPEVTRQEIEAAFALEHFGVADPRLAKIQTLLGTDLNPLTSAITYLDPKSGQWLGCDYDRRSWPLRQNPEAAMELSKRIAANMAEARVLLAQAEPQTDRQRERVKIWKWAIDCTEFFGRMIPIATQAPGTHDMAELEQLRTGLTALQERSEQLLSSWHTDWTMIAERYVRFGLHIEWCDQMIEARRATEA